MRMRQPVHGSNKLLLSQRRCLLRTEFSQLLGLLRVLFVKQVYVCIFSDKFISIELGHSGMFLVVVMSLRHGANGGFGNEKTRWFHRTPFDVLQMV